MRLGAASLLLVATLVVLGGGGASAARQSSVVAPPPPHLPGQGNAPLSGPFLKLLRAHAKKGRAPTAGPSARAARPRTATTPARPMDSTDASNLLSAMVAQGQSADFTGASYVTVPSNGTPDEVSTDLTTPLSAPGFPVDGSSFAVLTTGDANLAGTAPPAPGDLGPSVDDSCDPGPGCGTDGDPITKGVNRPAAHDVSILAIDVVVPSGMTCLSFDYRYLTSEFPDQIGTIYNDAFVAELDANTWTAQGATSLSPISAPDNFAFDPSHMPMSVNAVGTTSLSQPLATGTAYGGATPILRAATPVTPGHHTLYLSIFDQGDHSIDSAAFVDDLRLSALASTQCVTGSVVDEPPADVSVAVDGSTDGSTLTYTITVHNAGPNAANDVVLNDAIYGQTATNAYVDEVDTDTGSCDFTIVCDLGTLAAGAPATITVTASPDTTLGNGYVDYAYASSSTFDAVLDNNSGDAFVPVGNPGSADLGVQLVGPSSAHQGDSVDYQLLLSNNGPDDATGGITITMTLPSSFYYYGYTGSNDPSFDGCFHFGTTLTCSYESGYDAPSGWSDEIDIYAYVLSTGTATLTSTISADSETTDPFDANDTSRLQTSLLATTEDVGDLSVTQTADHGVVPPGSNLTYTIKVKNAGPHEVHQADFYDSISGYPDFETTDVGVNDSLGQCNDGTLDEFGNQFHCTLDLKAGQTDTIAYVVTVAPDAPADGSEEISNFAYVYPDTYFDPTIGNDSWLWYSYIRSTSLPYELADLEAKLTGPASAQPGQPVTSSMTVTNHGPSAADGSIYLALGANADAGQAVLSISPGCDPPSDFGVVYCDAGVLAPGGSKAFSVTWTTPTYGGADFAYAYAYSQYGNWADPNLGNNSAIVGTSMPDANADLALSMASSANTVLSGGTVSYVLTARNLGPTVAGTAQVVDTLPAGATVQTISGATCSGATVLTCNLGAFAAGKTATITITATLDSATPETVTNSALIASYIAYDFNPSNNSASVSTNVTALPAISGFTPGHGSSGTSVTITGANFTGATAVAFGGTPATSFTVDSDTQITATVADGTNSGPIAVTTPIGTGTSASTFWIAPTITDASPRTAAEHSTVTVTGTNFTGATQVTLGAVSVPFRVVSATTLTFTVPAGASGGAVAVTTPGGTATGPVVSVVPPPSIAGFTPGDGVVGTPVTITGTNLDHVVGVEIGHIVTVPTSVSFGQVVFTIPPGATSGTITLLATNGSATSIDTLTVSG